MTELNIIELINQRVLDYGNERFLEGWNSQQERIIKLLEAEMERIRLMDGYPATNALANIRAELIKGENKTNPWTSRPLTEEDEEHYGLEAMFIKISGHTEDPS